MGNADNLYWLYLKYMYYVETQQSAVEQICMDACYGNLLWLLLVPVVFQTMFLYSLDDHAFVFVVWIQLLKITVINSEKAHSYQKNQFRDSIVYEIYIENIITQKVDVILPSILVKQLSTRNISIQASLRRISVKHETCANTWLSKYNCSNRFKDV